MLGEEGINPLAISEVDHRTHPISNSNCRSSLRRLFHLMTQCQSSETKFSDGKDVEEDTGTLG